MRNAFVCVLFAALALPAISEPEPSRVVLSNYVMVVPKDITAAEKFVVDDVNELLSRSLGKSLPVVTAKKAPKTNRIFFKMPPTWFDYSKLSGRDAAVVCKDGDVWLFGRGANGVRYAAYDFLTVELGYRFFDARGGVKVPDLKSYQVRDGQRIVRYSFNNRKWSLAHLTGKEAVLFYFRTGLNYSLENVFQREGYPEGTVVDEFFVPWPFCHGLMDYFPKNRAAANLSWAKPFARDYDKEMPECFSLGKDGRRNVNHQPCLSHPEVRRVIKYNYFNMMARRDKPSYLDLSACDTPGRFCWCEACQALEKKYGTPGGPLLDLLLSYSPEAAKRYPDQKLLMLAYRKRQTELPPKKLERLPDNVIPTFAPIDDDFSKDWLHPNNAETLANLREWGRKCSEVLLWYYPNPYGERITPPLGNVYRLAADMRLMKEAGNIGLFFEHNVGVREMTGFSELQSYIIARLSRDVTLDVDTLIDEFLDFEYAAGAKSIRQYLNELEKLTADCQKRFAWDADIRSFDFLTPERLSKWGKLFDSVEKTLANDPEHLRNARRLRLGLDMATLEITKNLALLPRIRAILGEVVEDSFAAKYRSDGRNFEKKVNLRLRLLELRFGPNAKPLPKDIFGGIPQDNITIAMPVSSFGGMLDDPAAAYSTAAMLDSGKDGRVAKVMKLPFVANIETYLPRPTWKAAIGKGVTAENLGPKDAYKFYFMGETTLTKSLHVEFGSWGLRSHEISEAFKDGAFNKARIYASLKFQGPAFYPGDNRPNRVYCDRVVVVRDYDMK
jgi:hypothetical protein